MQYLLITKLIKRWGNICVVGDDDQSIYKFRGATIENILSFEDEYPGCRVIRLEQNYRSTSHILDAANAVIRNNQGRKGKELWTNGDTGEKLELYAADNENDEAYHVASQLMSSFGRGGSWSDNVVLYRMNVLSRQLEQAFKKNGIPYKIYGGTGYFDRAEIKDMLAYLCVVASPNDDLRLMRIINNPPRGIGAKSIETAQALAAENKVSLYEIIRRADEYPELSRASVKLRLFANMIGELNELSGELAPDLLYDVLLDKTGYLRMLEEKNTVEDSTRAENVRELKTSILNYKTDEAEPTLEGYLASVALYTDLDNYDAEQDYVSMMTMHSAKGLEFDNVFIVGAEEGIFPGLKTIGNDEEMEEERRLCYVALTRAKRRLFLSCAKQRMIFGRTEAHRVSPFVNEIPEEHIVKYGVQRERPAAQRSGLQREFARPAEHKSPWSVAPPPPKPASKSTPDYKPGNRIRHTAFGEGELIKMTPMGNDYLIEIAFDSGVTKKLMLRAAVLHMEKL